MEAILESDVASKGEDAYLKTEFWPGDHEIQRFATLANLQVLIAAPADLDNLDGEWRLMHLPDGEQIIPEQVGLLESVDAKFVKTRAHWGFGCHTMPPASAIRVADLLADALRKLGLHDGRDVDGARCGWVQYM